MALIQQKRLLDQFDAAAYLGISPELLFRFTRRGFARSSGLRSLVAVSREGQTWFDLAELDAFDSLLARPWVSAGEDRPAIPSAIVDHLKAESRHRCARCSSGIGVDTAHIIPWAETRSHHPSGLIRLCSACHREHDIEHSVPTEELLTLKQALIAQTRRDLDQRRRPVGAPLAMPRPAADFYGRTEELDALRALLLSGRSVLVTGTGGIGKTELLLQALSAVPGSRPIYWIDLERFPSVESIFAALRLAVGQGVACAPDALPGLLDASRACIVFDGIEQSADTDLDDLSDVVLEMSRTTRSVQILATSQVALPAWPADARIGLGGLDAEASRRLIEHVVTIGPVSATTGLDLLVEFCDGHALSLRIVAALIDHYGTPAATLAAIVGDQQDLHLPGRTRHTRSTSLDRCLAAAYRTLDVASRELLWALANAPGGVFTFYLEQGWPDDRATLEASRTLRRWHFTVERSITDEITRTHLLAPIRHFAIARARSDAPDQYQGVVARVVEHFEMTVAVLEIEHRAPEETPYVLARYGDELANFLHVLDLAHGRPTDAKLVAAAAAIMRSLMRYFFVTRLHELGARSMLEASGLAIDAGLPKLAVGLAMQLIALAERARRPDLALSGLAQAERIAPHTTDPFIVADIAMCRAMIAGQGIDHLAAETAARDAFEHYSACLREHLSKVDDETKEPDFLAEEIHNDISSALTALGFALLKQAKFADAGATYRHALQHLRGGAIAVNRGQLVHQIGNCESNLEHHAAAADCYLEAAQLFYAVGVEEYLSNALGELGYTLLDYDAADLCDRLEPGIVAAGLADLKVDVRAALRLDTPINHDLCVGMLRKLLGLLFVASLAGQSEALAGFATTLAAELLLPLRDQVEASARGREELFPIIATDDISRLCVAIAIGEDRLAKRSCVAVEDVEELVTLVGRTHPWVWDFMRLADWLSAFLDRRWQIDGADSTTLRHHIADWQAGNRRDLALTPRARS